MCWMDPSTARLTMSGCSQYAACLTSAMISVSACVIRSASNRCTGGGAYRFASPLISSVGRVIVSSIGLVVLEELMDTATRQPRGRGDLSDRQPGLVGGDDRPDPFLLCLG